MTLEQGDAGTSEYIIDSGNAISTRCCELVSGTIEACVEHLIIVAAEGLYALPTADVPELACAIDTSGQTIVASEVELPAGKFSGMPLQCENTLSGADVPDFGCVIE